MYSSAIVMPALSQAGSPAAIVPLMAVAGLAAESYRPASSALLADLVPQGRRVTAFAAYRLAIGLLPSRPEAHHEAPAGSLGAVRTILADRAFLALLATSLIIGLIHF